MSYPLARHGAAPTGAFRFPLPGRKSPIAGDPAPEGPSRRPGTGLALSAAVGSDEIDELGTEILAFLKENPKARDTLKGIAEWWLLERDVRRETEKIRQALARLVAAGWLVERREADGRVHYRLNEDRLRGDG